MHLQRLKLTNFRNHPKFETEFDQKTTLIVGSNAAGKTNILEAIYYLATGRSFKAKFDRDVISHLQDYSRIEGEALTTGSLVDLEMFLQKNPNFENATVKKVKVNKVPKTLQFFIGQFNAVLFSPEDISTITGTPSERRKFIDNILNQVSLEYKRIHSEYIQAVKHRNKILEKIREFGRGNDELGYWNTKIVQSGVLVQEHRQTLINYLSQKLISYGIDLNDPQTVIKINYLKSEISYERLHDYQDKEIAAKSTLIGPHRDDFEITLNDFNIADFGSRGQQRSAVLALKMGEVDYITEKTGERPTLLLDDVFSELDQKHEEALMDVVKKQQTIITTTETPQQLDFVPFVISLRETL